MNFLNFSGVIKDLLSAGVFVWNIIINMAFNLLGANPISFKGGGPWWFVRDLEPTFVAIASPLVVVFFLWGFCSQSVDIREEIRFETIVRLLARLCIANWLVTNMLSLMSSMFNCVAAWVKLITKTKGLNLTVSSGLISSLDSLNWASSFVLCLITVILVLVIIASAFMIVYTVYYRFAKIFLLVPYGCIAASTLAGGEQISHTFVSFCRYFFAVLLEAVTMCLAIAICNKMMSSGIGINFDGIENLAPFAVCLIKEFELTFSAVMTVGFVKGAEQLTTRALGL